MVDMRTFVDFSDHLLKSKNIRPPPNKWDTVSQLRVMGIKKREFFKLSSVGLSLYCFFYSIFQNILLCLCLYSRLNFDGKL